MLTQACSVEAMLGADACSLFIFSLRVDVGKPFLLGHVRCLKMTLTQCTARLLLQRMLWLLLLSMLWWLLLSMLWRLLLWLLWQLLLSMLWWLLVWLLQLLPRLTSAHSSCLWS